MKQGYLREEKKTVNVDIGHALQSSLILALISLIWLLLYV